MGCFLKKASYFFFLYEIFGLSKLSVWWLRLGIDVERIRPGNPQENGRHERMHLSLKKDLLQNPALNTLSQQEVFDNYIEDFNHERPHAALNNETPSTVYKKSKVKYKKSLCEIKYPGCERTINVFSNGKINIKPKLATHLCSSLAFQQVGLTEVEENIWRIQFLDIVLGHFDTADNSFSSMKEIVRI